MFMKGLFPVIVIAAIICVAASETCNGRVDGNYPDPTSCYRFISCSNGIPHVMNCPETLKFDHATNQCKHPHEVSCGAVGDCGGRPDGIYTNPGSNCDSFVKCVANLEYVYDCPGDLKFNPNHMVCDYASNFVCSDVPV